MTAGFVTISYVFVFMMNDLDSAIMLTNVDISYDEINSTSAFRSITFVGIAIFPS